MLSPLLKTDETLLSKLNVMKLRCILMTSPLKKSWGRKLNERRGERPRAHFRACGNEGVRVEGKEGRNWYVA